MLVLYCHAEVGAMRFTFLYLLFSAQDPSAMPRPTSQDLAGFWDLLQLSVDDVTAKFDELHQIKNNHWQLVESPEKKVEMFSPTVHTFMLRFVSYY